MIELVFFDDHVVDKEIKEKLDDMNETDLKNLIFYLMNKRTQLRKDILKY